MRTSTERMISRQMTRHGLPRTGTSFPAPISSRGSIRAWFWTTTHSPGEASSTGTGHLMPSRSTTSTTLLCARRRHQRRRRRDWRRSGALTGGAVYGHRRQTLARPFHQPGARHRPDGVQGRRRLDLPPVGERRPLHRAAERRHEVVQGATAEGDDIRRAFVRRRAVRLEHGGKYLLLYSRCGARCFDSLDYAVGDALRGPYAYRGTIIAHGKQGTRMAAFSNSTASGTSPTTTCRRRPITARRSWNSFTTPTAATSPRCIRRITASVAMTAASRLKPKTISTSRPA